MKRISEIQDREHGGFVVLLFLLLTAIIFTSLAFAVDIGKASDQQRQIQIAADAASLAGVQSHGSDASYSRLLATILAIAQANNVSESEVILTPPRCGRWESNSFIPQSDGTCDTSSTAVEVTIRRSVPANFARLANKSQFNLTAQAVAFLSPSAIGSCIRPFGIEESFLSSLGASDGDTFSVSGTPEAGNWGKIDLNGNASSGEEYTNLMLHNLCDKQIAVGGSVSTGTGNAAIEQVFEAILNDTSTPSPRLNMVFAITSDFGKGNSFVELKRFVRVDLLSQQGSGPKWRATFKIVELDTQPDSPSQPTRQLMQ